MGFGVFGFGGLFGLNLWTWFLDCVCGWVGVMTTVWLTPVCLLWCL